MISLARGNSSAQAQGFCSSSPDPFSSLEVGSGDETMKFYGIYMIAVCLNCTMLTVMFIFDTHHLIG